MWETFNSGGLLFFSLLNVKVGGGEASGVQTEGPSPDTVHTMTSHVKNFLTTSTTAARAHWIAQRAAERGGAEAGALGSLSELFAAEGSRAGVQTGSVSLPASENQDPKESWMAGSWRPDGR